jgi:hypothetical protein
MGKTLGEAGTIRHLPKVRTYESPAFEAAGVMSILCRECMKFAA